MKIGEKIKRSIVNSPYSVSDMAQRLETSTQNMYKIFKKDSVDTKYLEKICEILKLDISSFFKNPDSALIYTPSPEEMGLLLALKQEKDELEKRILNLKEQISNYRKRVSILKAQLEDKGKIINLLEEKIKILTEVASVYELIKSTKKEDEHFYLDLNDVDSLLNDLERMRVNLSDKKEKEKFIKAFLEKKVKGEKRKKE